MKPEKHFPAFSLAGLDQIGSTISSDDGFPVGFESGKFLLR
jgi:hypothetical protein